MKKILVTMVLMIVASALVFANSANYIPRERAMEIVFSDAGENAGEASYVRAHMDREHGKMIYDVEIHSGSAEYDYEIDASSGEIISMDMDVRHWSAITGTAGDSITEERAVELALENAGLSRGDVIFLYSRPKKDHRMMVFEVKFATATTVYEYKVDAEGGRIISREIERQRSRVNNPNNILSIEEATQLVLKRVNGATADKMRIRLDYDDGRLIYEGVLWHDGYKYEFEINAENGRFLDWDRERR